MVPSKIFHDEIPDSLFREMFKKNTLSLCFLAIISACVSLFFYFHIMQDRYIIQTHVSIYDQNNKINQQSNAHQKLIRILKSEEVRAKVIASNNLVAHYGIDSNKSFYQIQLDKQLYDCLKVEEQYNGTILIRFKDPNLNVCKKVVNDLIVYSNNSLHNYLKNTSLEIRKEEFRVENDNAKWSSKLFSLILLITSPVLLIFVLFVAIKEKILLDIKSETPSN